MRIRFTNKTRCLRLLLTVFSMALFNCAEKEKLIDFPVAMEIEIRKHFYQKERQIGLFVKTVQEYECANYQIEYDYTHNAEQRIVDFKGIILPSSCLTAFGPATAFVNFGHMDENQHQVQFLIDQDYLITDFLIGKDKISIIYREDETDLIGFAEKTIYRLTDDYVWGYVLPKSAGHDVDTNDFFNALWKAGAKMQELSPGNYGFFRITGEDMIIFDQEVSHRATFPIICTYEGQFETLSQIADDFSHELIIVLCSAQGDYHRNQH